MAYYTQEQIEKAREMNEPPCYGKDMNDELMHMLQKNPKKERENHVR